jgi:hypothetical protein
MPRPRPPLAADGRPELEDFAERHGIQSQDELTDLMGGSP